MKSVEQFIEIQICDADMQFSFWKKQLIKLEDENSVEYVRTQERMNAESLRAISLREVKEKLNELKPKVYGTDECPICETAPVGMNYNRVTLFYYENEHDSHKSWRENGQ